MNVKKRAQILGTLVEGNSLRATSRLADCSINTVTKLLIDVGTACAEYQDKALRNCQVPDNYKAYDETTQGAWHAIVSSPGWVALH